MAASLVFVHHSLFHPLFSDQGLQNAYTYFVFNLGPISLTFFFVLSGFILTWSANPRDTKKQFWRRRFFKIFPANVVMWVIILLLTFVAGRAIPWPETLVSLPLLQAWVPSFNFQLLSLNPPSWTLSIELLFYLAFPLLIVLVNRIRPSRLWLYGGLVVVAALLMPVISRLLLPSSPMMPAVSPSMSWPQLWFVYYFPVARMFEFLAGMVMAKILLTGRWRNVRPLFTVVLLVVAYLATLPLNLFAEGLQSIFIIPIALVITAAAAADVAGRRTLWNSRGMVWLGQLSYSFYLVHITVFFSLWAAFDHQWGLGGMFNARPFGTVAGIAFLIGSYVLCVLASWLLYVLVERPMMRRWARSRRARPAVTSPAVT